MSDNISVKANFTADDEASPVIKNLLRQVKKLEKVNFALSADRLKTALTGATTTAARLADNQRKATAALRDGLRIEGQRVRTISQADKALKQRLTFQARMQRQRSTEETRSARAAAKSARLEETARSRGVAAAARADMMKFRQLRERLAFQTRMSRQRANEAREVERADARRETAHRRELGRIDRESRARRRAFAVTGRTSTGAIRDVSTGVGIAGAAGAAATLYAGRSILSREADVDAAERNAQIYGGLSRVDARKLRDQWAGPAGIQLGASAAEMLTGYTDALKAGIPDTDAKAFASLSIQVAEMWSLPTEMVNEILGGVKAIQTADGSAFNMSGISAWANTLQLLAGKLSTTPELLLQYNKQAAGGAALLGMSQNASLAFGAASTTLGNRAGESGSALDFVAGRVAAMPQLTKQDGIEGDRARKLLRTLGYGNAAGMERARKSDPDQFVFDLLERLHRVKDPRKRNEAALALAGQEWLGEIGRMVTGIGVVREAREIQRSARGVDAIGSAWGIHAQKLLFVGKQVVASFLGIVGEFGKVLGPLAIDAGRYFIDWARKNSRQLGINFWAATRGLVEGLLGREGSFNDLLKAAFGSDLTANPQRFYAFAKGVGEGLREIWAGLKWLGKAAKSFLKALGVDGSDPEAIGKLAAEIFGVSIAAKLASGPLGIVKDAMIAIGAGIVSIVGAARLAGLLGGGSALAAGVAGVAGVMSLPVLAGVAIVGGALAVAIMNWDGIRDGLNSVTEKLGAWESSKWQQLKGLLGLGSEVSGSGGSPALPGGSIGADRLSGADLAPAGLMGGTGGGGKPMLDAIARAEGTSGRGDYEATLGYGRYGTPSKPLTTMTLDEAFKFGREIKAKHGSSSAIGRYQIVGSTMMDAAKALGMDPASTKFDATTQDRMATWIKDRQGFGAWEGFKRNPAELATAKAAAAGVPLISGAAAGSQAGAADIAARFSGLSETGPGRGTLNSFLKAENGRIDAARTAWCAAFVNSSLGSVGIKGSGSLAASSFLKWGQGVDPSSVAKGDVMVEHRGRRPGETGAHVGMATGETRTGPNGQLQLKMISGNSGGRRAGGGAVQTTWESASKVAVRRAAGQVPAMNATSLSASVPARPATVSGGPGQVPGAGGGAGGSIVVNAPITINGAGQNPEQIASAVEQRLQARSMFRTHDVEYDQ